MWADAFRSQIKHRFWRIRLNIIVVFLIHLELKFASAMSVLNEWIMQHLNNISYLDRYTCVIDSLVSIAIHHDSNNTFCWSSFFILKICLVIIAPPSIPALDEHLAARTFISKNSYAQSTTVYISLTRLIKQTEGSEQRNKEYQQTGGGGEK